MCTISLTYDQDNALAQRMLSELLKSGLFKQTETVTDRELYEIERRMDAYEQGEMSSVSQSEIYNRVMDSIWKGGQAKR
ncbi:MAG: hypothetical protein IKJ40_09790 [Bacteroidales bacterium]|nr:hypothetical protein [Bacteroidales bacterium]